MIIYFTGTGNSRIIAKRMGELLEDTVTDAFSAIREGGTHVYSSEKPYVFVCPTYAWDIPRIFRTFLLSSRFTGNPRAYFLMTCGGSIGDPSEGLKKLCIEKGLTYCGVKAVVMPENYAAMFSVPGQEESDRIIEKAVSGLPETAKKIADDMPFAKERQIFGRLKTGPVNRAFYKYAINAKAFTAGASCTGCGTCEAVCPLGNISLTDGRPLWGDRCTHCMACLSACPESALEYGKSSAKRNRIYNGIVREREQ